ncbi:prepilin peptidase [Sulfurimonas autotrophica]|uniref:Peptidase A24A prepilin type IV n=1 Tax=Sulfurimonas autotrophica (strain ATCC BAA-671 / DSM 16294 / JCM 11897 / OK10) TaxID=563040 RepID=E0UQL5_SULAO|nr:prepilin peptidase [Sulfurimonas autotrophica]ADN09887.1 peptidase A24A prepilin type IV [Sulfurimonas autotrophica DSM 16294]
MIILVYFIIIAFIISYIDSKKRIIPDKIIIPAFVGLLILKWLDASLSLNDAIAVILILVIFLVPIILNMAFGGGDLRFGAFCALFVGLGSIGYFIMLSGIIHLLILGILKKKSYGFAPAMSAAAIISYFIGKL